MVAQSEAFFHSWGALAVFFARFVAPIRAFVPITAGALGMPPLRFYSINIPAILVWAFAHVLPGVLAISALHEYFGVPHHYGTKHLWMLAVLGGGGDRRCDLDYPPPTGRRDETAKLISNRPGCARAPGRHSARGDGSARLTQLFAGMRDPADRARHGEQHQFMAGRQAERMHQHCQRIVDIANSPVASAMRSRDFVGELGSAPARASASSSACARGSPCL